MSTIKITYFDFHGGRAEPVRMAFSIAGVEFDDERISFQQFGEMRQDFPLNAVPVMEVDGTGYTQTNAMLRYAGSKAGLYPNDPWQAFLCDEVLDLGEDMFHAIGKTFGLEGDAFKEARQAFVAGPMTSILKLLAARLEAAGGEFFADNRLTVADFKVMIAVQMVTNGMLDHVPSDGVSQIAPSLLAHMESVQADPRVAAYLEKRG